MAKKFSRETPLGDAARYILKNYDVLTAYLSNPRLPHTNDLSERMLRCEKLIQANSLFRQSIKGRCALDIVRSVLQTCVAANVNAQQYLNWLLPQDEDAINARPHEFTPLAFSKITEK